jgi:hypothetical protein
MTRRKRGDDDGEAPIPQKRTRGSSPTRRSERKPMIAESYTTKEGVNETAAARKPTPRNKRTSLGTSVEEPVEVLSDSSSLSDPPSTVRSPTPPLAPLTKTSKGTKSRRAAPKKTAPIKKPSLKEHEEALMMLSRDDTEDDSSESSSDKPHPNGLAPESADDEEEHWEDIDLSHKKPISFDDLAPSPEPQNLEVTLERTQQSMRIKYPSRNDD